MLGTAREDIHVGYLDSEKRKKSLLKIVILEFGAQSAPNRYFYFKVF